MKDGDYRLCRRVLAVASAAVLISVFAVVIFSMSTVDDWFEVSDVNVEAEQSDLGLGMYVVVDCETDIESRMPFDITGMEAELVLVDDTKGSQITLGRLPATDLKAGEVNRLNFSTKVFAPGAVMIISDLVDRDGSVMHFRLNLSCSYILGLADFDLRLDADLPLSDPDRRVSAEHHRVSPSSLYVEATGLREGIVPSDGTLRFAGGGTELEITLSSSGDRTVLSLDSPVSLESDLDRLLGSADTMAYGTDGSPVAVDPGVLKIIRSALDLSEGLP